MHGRFFGTLKPQRSSRVWFSTIGTHLAVVLKNATEVGIAQRRVSHTRVEEVFHRGFPNAKQVGSGAPRREAPCGVLVMLRHVAVLSFVVVLAAIIWCCAVMRSCVTQSMPKGNFLVTWGWRK